MTEEDFRKETPLGEVVHPERKVKDRARITLRGIVRIRLMFVCILPYVEITNSLEVQIRRHVSVRHIEADSQPSKKLKESGGKGSVALGVETFGLRTRVQSRRSPSRFLRITTKSWGSDRTVRFSWGTLHTVKNRERKGLSPGVFQKCEPRERSL